MSQGCGRGRYFVLSSTLNSCTVVYKGIHFSPQLSFNILLCYPSTFLKQWLSQVAYLLLILLKNSQNSGKVRFIALIFLQTLVQAGILPLNLSKILKTVIEALSFSLVLAQFQKLEEKGVLLLILPENSQDGD